MKPHGFNKQRVLIILAGLVFSGALGLLLDRAVLAQQSGIKRTVLRRTDDPAAGNYEVVMAIAELAPGATAGKHYHHGVEIGYVLEGSLTLEHQNRPTITVNPGDSFQNDPAAPHNAKNAGSTPAKVLAVYIVEKGKPLAEPLQ